MEEVNWRNAPPDAEAWAPDTAKFMDGWYKTDSFGRWYFTREKRGAWWNIEPPSAYRRRQMVRRPK